MANETLAKYYTSTSSTRTTQTLSLWFKLNQDTKFGAFMASGQEVANDGIYTKCGLDPNGRLEVRWWDDSGNLGSRYSSLVIRDTNKWYHVVYVFDTTQASAEDRIRIYLNGERITSWNASSNPTQNKPTWFGFNGKKHRFGTYNYSSADVNDPFDGLISDAFFVDGQALDSSAFGKSVSNKHIWKPKHPDAIKTAINSSGGFGSAGFYLPLNTDTTEDVNISIQYYPDTIYANAMNNHTRMNMATGNGWAEYGSLTTNSSGGPFGLGYVSNFSLSSENQGSLTNVRGMLTGYSQPVSDWGAVTLMAWAKTSNTQARPQQWCVEVPVLGDYRNSVYGGFGIDEGKVAFGNNSVYRGTTVIADGNWHHIALVFDGSNTFQMYADGVAEGSTFLRSDLTSPGALRCDSVGFHYPYAGVSVPDGVAGVQVIGRALTQSEIQEAVDGKIYTIGKDESGNGQHWVPENKPVISKNTPVNNFATLNSNVPTSAGNYRNGGCRFSGGTGSGWSITRSTIGMKTGKWYWEMRQNSTVNIIPAGIMLDNAPTDILPGQNRDDGTSYYSNGDRYYGPEGGGSGISFGSGWTTVGDIIQFAFDADSGKMWWGKNGTWQASGNPANGSNPGTQLAVHIGKDWFASVGGYNSPTDITMNFGQGWTWGSGTQYSDSNGIGTFAYQPPSGFLALCTQNMVEPVVTNPENHFKVISYTGNHSYPRDIDVGFQPDLVWIKNNTSGYHWRVFDRLRDSAPLYLNNTEREDNFNDGPEVETYSYSNGFRIIDNPDGVNTGGAGVNVNGDNHIAYCWKAAGAAAATNTEGSISVTTSANTEAGFSIVRYTGTSANMTFGHGLNKRPDFIIFRKRTGADEWVTYPYGNLDQDASTTTRFLRLHDNSTGASDTVLNTVTDTLIGLGNSGARNTSGQNYIAYIWHEVEGYSKFGTYESFKVGTNSGPFVYCGFKPAFVMVKCIDTGDTNSNWTIWDNARQPFNVLTPSLRLEADTTNITDQDGRTNDGNGIDFTANGFKLRASNWYESNAGGTFIFMAFAESPFKYNTAV
jgi:hypothetical protein